VSSSAISAMGISAAGSLMIGARLRRDNRRTPEVLSVSDELCATERH
jgi:hypothetical protein